MLTADLRDSPGPPRDITDRSAMAPLLAEADGIVHLAAVSRVVDAQRNPDRCWAVNADATRDLLDAAIASPRRPWVIYASSREVYGQQDVFPVTEDAEFRPLNIYARSKVEAERLCGNARAAGLRTSIVRFSSVYGSVDDHATRVVPAFIRGGVAGTTLNVEGRDHAFDLTHVDDVVRGVLAIIDQLHAGEAALPPIHFTSGTALRLADLAEKAIALGGNRAALQFTAPRTYDISHFVGDPSRARTLLGWQATTSLDEGLARLARDFAALLISR